MKEYSLADAMHLLAITNRQLDRLLAIAGIDKQSLADASNKDKRRKLLTQEQFDMLVSLHQKEPQSGDHESRILTLERRVRELEALVKVQSTVSVTRPHASATTERRLYTGFSTERDTLPVDWYPLHTWAEIHGLGLTTLKEAIRAERVPGHKAPDGIPWRRGRTTIAWAIAPEQRTAILAVYRPGRLCGEATCPCSAM
jgi:hypothetical protein